MIIIRFRINYGQITTTQTLLPLVEELKSLCCSSVSQLQVFLNDNKLKINLSYLIKILKDSIGFNLAAVRFLKEKVEENDQVRLFADVSVKYREKTKKTKKVALLSLKSASSVS